AAERWASERGLVAGIEFIGMVPYDEMIRRLALEVNVLVHPALEESFGMTLIEAMALRIPVIGGRRSGAVPWVLDQGRVGRLVEASDSEEMAEAMIVLGENADERERLGEAGWKSAKDRFDIATVADAYERIYHQMAAQS